MATVLETKLISSYKNEMISFLKFNPRYFNEAMNLAVSNKQPFAWRSAFLLFDCMEINDKRVKKNIKTIVESIKDKNDGHQRELLKILYKMEINEKYEGILFNICIDLWEQINKSPSVRVTALKFIFKLIKKHHELFDEIKYLLQDQYLVTLSPGVKYSVEKMILELNGKKTNKSEVI